MPRSPSAMDSFLDLAHLIILALSAKSSDVDRAPTWNGLRTVCVDPGTAAACMQGIE